jgi:hypothetical protein
MIRHVACAAALLLAAAAPALADEPVEGASNWMLIDSVTADCWAETGNGNSFAPGDTIHVKLMFDDRDHVILMGARPDWRKLGVIAFGLSIDGGDPELLRGHGANSLVVAVIDDPELLQRLRQASRLEWQLPWGMFSAKVLGLGIALDAVDDCR